MRTFALSFILVVAVLSGLSPAATPGTRPAEQTSDSTAPGGQQIIRELNLPKGSSAADLLHHLRQLDPAFQYVAEPGPWQDTLLPEIQLRDVGTTEVMMILSNLVPDLKMQQVTGSVWVVNSRSRGGSGQQTQLSAFGLADSVERIGLKEAWATVAKDQGTPTADQIAAGRKQALQEVLSLLESAVTQADPSFQPSLKLHEGTGVLLVRGTPAQLNAVSEAIRALQSTPGMAEYERTYKHLADQYAYTKAKLDDMKEEQKAWMRTADHSNAQIAELKKENAALKRQLQDSAGKGDEKH